MIATFFLPPPPRPPPYLQCNQSVSLPFNVPKHLRVSQELPKVYVEHVAAGLQHDVIVVAIADPQDVRRDAATGA